MSRETQNTESTRTGKRAVVAARDADEQPDTTEIRELTGAAGHEVVGEVTQQRAADATYGLGRGKAEKLMRRTAAVDADLVVYDGELTPGQTFSLGELLPPGTDVIDRTRLVLDLFADGAGSRAAALQVELARLRYEKPRLAEGIARDVADENRFHDEGDKRVLDVERRIESIERNLAAISDDRAAHRERRRENGFDLLAVAGYTNAGKSTLLHRLADDMDLGSIPDDSDDPEADTAGKIDVADQGLSTHNDLDTTATVANRLFETLETTTRRATIGGRRTLLTDTVGFIDALPHRSVKSFTATLDTVRNADAVLLVADASDDPTQFRRKLQVSIEAIAEPNGPVIPVLNKVDQIEPSTVQERIEAVAELQGSLVPDRADNVDEGSGPTVVPAAEALQDPIPISAIEGQGIESLEAIIEEVLPTARTTLFLPNTGETQSLLSWAYDHGNVVDVAYEGDRVRIEFTGNPSAVTTVERKAAVVSE